MDGSIGYGLSDPNEPDERTLASLIGSEYVDREKDSKLIAQTLITLIQDIAKDNELKRELLRKAYLSR